MRFEVKGGGITAIVLALTLLSGAVFVMGLLAGYDVGRQAQLDMAQLATSYPLQAVPSSGAATSSAAEPANAATAAPASAAITPAAAPSAAEHNLTADSGSPERQPSQANATSARKRLASVPPASESSSPPAADEDLGAAAESETPEPAGESPTPPKEPELQARGAVASTATAPHHRPYNIQIEAAMDIRGADQMMTRLQKLGYPSHLVPTEIAGQRWYKVEVGPYATVGEASSAEAQLRRKYDSTYGRAGSDSSAGETSAGDNAEE